MQLDSQARRALILLPVLLLGGCTNAPDKPVTLEKLPECGRFPNCVNTQSGRGVQASEPIRATAQQWQKLKTWIRQQKNWEVLIDEEHFMQAVAKTPVMRFRDDVQLLFLPDIELIQVRSSSRLGLSDLGVNARRVETLRNQLAPWSGGVSQRPDRCRRCCKQNSVLLQNPPHNRTVCPDTRAILILD